MKDASLRKHTENDAISKPQTRSSLEGTRGLRPLSVPVHTHGEAGSGTKISASRDMAGSHSWLCNNSTSLPKSFREISPNNSLALSSFKFKGCHCQNSPSPPPRSHQDPSRLLHWLHWGNTSTRGRSQTLLVPGTEFWGSAHIFRILSPHSDFWSFLTCWFECHLHSPHDFSPDWSLTSDALIQDPVLHSFLVPQL